jgi:prevent-host-death family protein
MSRTVNSTLAKGNVGSLLAWSEETGEPVIVERRGCPVGVILSYAAFEDLKEQEDRLRRVEAWTKWHRLREELSERNSDLTQEEAEMIADRVSRDAIESMIAKGKIRFVEPEEV